MIQHASNSGYLAYCAALAPLTNVSKHNKLGSNGRVLLPIHALCIRYGSERTAESTHSSTDLHGYGQTCAKELQQSWTKLKILTFSPVLFVFLQFIPDFMRHAKIRIKEHRRRSPRDAEVVRRRKPAVGRVQAGDLKCQGRAEGHTVGRERRTRSVGNDGTVLGEDLHVVPRVAKIYREYANGILKACAILRVVRGGGLKSYIYLEHYYCNNLQRYVLNGQD